jgi:hypothetical protein
VVKNSQPRCGVSWVFHPSAVVNERPEHNKGILIGAVVSPYSLGKSTEYPEIQLFPQMSRLEILRKDQVEDDAEKGEGPCMVQHGLSEKAAQALSPPFRRHHTPGVCDMTGPARPIGFQIIGAGQHPWTFSRSLSDLGDRKRKSG